MAGSLALGLPLVKKGDFAADMLRFAPYAQTSLHTHPGDHILFVYQGDGWLDYGDETHDLVDGTCYLVEGNIPHRVRASSVGMLLLSVAIAHQSVDSADRLQILED